MSGPVAARTCPDCGKAMYGRQKLRCALCAIEVKRRRGRARYHALSPEEKADRVVVARIKREAYRLARVCVRCRVALPPEMHTWTCDKCCGKRKLQKRVAERRRRRRIKS